jgi:hypothetical protein
MREGHSPSKAIMAAHEMKCMAEGGVDDEDKSKSDTDKWLDEPDISSPGEPEVVPESQSPHRNEMPPRKTSTMAHGGMKNGHLTANARNHMKASTFAGPDRSYPINDASHARNALSRVSANGSPAVKAEVRAAVHRKFPGIGK